MACINPDGSVLWSVRAPEEPDAGSLFPLTTDGNSVWLGGLRKDGTFRVGKFDPLTLRKKESIQFAAAPSTRNMPCVQWHSDAGKDFDLQISLVQSDRNSVHVFLISGDLQLLWDKTYTFPFIDEEQGSLILDSAYLTRLADHSGYYLFLRRPLRATTASVSGVAIVRLNNDGKVKWANSYAIGYSDFEVEPHFAADGAIIFNAGYVPNAKAGLLVKVDKEGEVKWATSIAGLQSLGVHNASSGWAPLQFTRPYLMAYGGNYLSGKPTSYLLALNYQTGDIERQVRVNGDGSPIYAEESDSSFYVSFLKPGPSLRSGDSRASLIRLDFDLNVKAACNITGAEPHWPIFRALPSRDFLLSYSYSDRKTVVLEKTNEAFESTSNCGVLQKETVSVTRTNFKSQPSEVQITKLPEITVSDGKTKTREAEIALLPLALEETPCAAHP
ncbi:MAG: hypothetical protein ACR2II_07870 [Chthoniobacterales bacterium]